MANLGNILDATIVNPLKTLLGEIAEAGVTEAKTLATDAQDGLESLETAAASVLTNSQSAVDTEVNSAVTAIANAAAAAYPPLAPVIQGGAAAATPLTDAVLNDVMTWASNLLSTAAKSGGL